MRKLTFLLTALVTVFLLQAPLYGQVAYSPTVEAITQEITAESLMDLENPITGTTPATIGGDTYTIATRNAYTEGNEKAAQWIYERFEEFGYAPWYHEYDDNGTNVLAELTGTEYPEKYFMICGHYDDMPAGSFAPGADDNASGTVTVLEAARILFGETPKYSIRFALWDEEEYGLIGSGYYADEAAANGDEIFGVINLDMIAWESEGDFMCSITDHSTSHEFTNNFISIMNLYEPMMEYNSISTTSSDHSSFWNQGYPALLLIEDMDDFNAYYHTVNDDIDILNMEYFVKMSRTAMAGLCTFAFDYFVTMDHEAILSGPSEDDRIAKLYVENLSDMDDGENAPRLYYSVDEDDYLAINAYNSNDDTLYFAIPGQELGATINYYFAVQGDEGGYIASLPTGARGINPPGTEAPENNFMYLVDEIYNIQYCSNTTPINIIDNETVADTISIEESGIILDVNVMVDITHSYDGDIQIHLEGPAGDNCPLSIANGGNGENYDETIFDDEAETSITSATAPFSGTYQPQFALSMFDEQNMNDDWILKVYDGYSGDEGVLENWCLFIEYTPTSGVNNENIVATESHLEIYPNPTQGILNIATDFEKTTDATIAIYDMYGRMIRNVAQKQFNSGNHLIKTNIEYLPSGQYIVLVITDHGKMAKKLILQ